MGDNSVAELYGIVADTVNLATSFECISFSWILRDKNRVADVLVKQALLSESVVRNTAPLLGTKFEVMEVVLKKKDKTFAATLN